MTNPSSDPQRRPACAEPAAERFRRFLTYAISGAILLGGVNALLQIVRIALGH